MSAEMLATTVDEMLRRTCTRAAREASTTGLLDESWRVLVDGGLPWVSVDEEAGGSGGSVVALVTILQGVGRHAATVPLAETALASWLRASAGLAVGEGTATVVTAGADVRLRRDGSQWKVDARLERVPWARVAGEVVYLADADGTTQVVVVPIAECELEHGSNLAGEPRDTVVATDVALGDDAVAIARDGLVAEARQRSALYRAAQMAGALQGAGDMTARYALERKQFGKPIATFQAIQQRLSLSLEQVSSAKLAVDVAAAALEQGDASIAIAAAKIACSLAATEVMAHAHQVHGAIGLTAEYDLQFFVRALASWQWEDGSIRTWSEELGGLVLERDGGAGLWDVITSSLIDSAGSTGLGT